jgi:hypothetical protein
VFLFARGEKRALFCSGRETGPVLLTARNASCAVLVYSKNIMQNMVSRAASSGVGWGLILENTV